MTLAAQARLPDRKQPGTAKLTARPPQSGNQYGEGSGVRLTARGEQSKERLEKPRFGIQSLCFNRMRD
jgi:hypothetical protein